MPDTPSCPRCGVALLEPEDDSSCPACLLALALDSDETRPGTGHSLDPISDHLPTLPPHYRLESRVGSGGMGLVYRAVDTRLNRPVAIKAVHDARLLEPGASARFRAEALAAASLDHPFICKVYELLESGRKALLVMEFVEGETLAGILRQGRPPLARTIELISEIAEGLANAHAMGLVHRDIKPSNVMVTPHGHVKLLDFGLARPEVLTEASTTRGTGMDGDARAGTPHYMAPEQAEGKPITARADIFSLGVVAFECIAGELPFDGATEYIYVHALVHDAPKSLAQLAPDTPKELIRLVERCLSKDPSSRPESAAAVARELRQIAETSVTPTVHTLRAASLQKSRNRWAQIAIVSLVATVAIAVAITVWRPWSLGDAQFRQQALVTWPSDEWGSAISPDGRWVSFLSYRDGQGRAVRAAHGRQRRRHGGHAPGRRDPQSPVVARRNEIRVLDAASWWLIPDRDCGARGRHSRTATRAPVDRRLRRVTAVGRQFCLLPDERQECGRSPSRGSDPADNFRGEQALEVRRASSEVSPVQGVRHRPRGHSCRVCGANR